MLQGTLLLFVAAANLGAISIFITSASRYIGCPRGESVNQVIQVFVFVLVGNKLQADMKFFLCEVILDFMKSLVSTGKTKVGRCLAARMTY